MRWVVSTLILSSLSSLIDRAHALFVVNCQPITVQRIDPIVSPGQLSSHVHVVQGTNTFSASVTTEDLVRSTCTTCGFKEDLSAYWTPNLYYKRIDGTYEIVGDGGLAVYYLNQRAAGNPSEKILAPPAGFKMIAGNPKRTTFNASSVADQSVQFVCIGTPLELMNEFPSIDCPGGLRAQILFPNCWDGVNLDSPTHNTHVSYSSQKDYGVCPESHPYRIVTPFYENFYDIHQYVDGWINSTTGVPFREFPFIFSTADSKGYSFHGDFMNGWNVSMLQKTIDECDTSGVPCTTLTPVSGDELSACHMDNPYPLSNEQVYGQLWQLPNFPSTQVAHRYTDSPVHLGCYADSINARLLPTLLGVDDQKNNPAWCINLAIQRGFKFAGVEFGKECYGSSTAPSVIAPRSHYCNQRCPAPMPDNDIYYCGGAGAINVYAVNDAAYQLSGFTSPVPALPASQRPASKALESPFFSS